MISPITCCCSAVETIAKSRGLIDECRGTNYFDKVKRHKTVDEFLRAQGRWQAELVQLRDILSGCGLTEELKWGAPCYSFAGKNVVGIGAFKSYFGLWFFQGALLRDEAGVLVNAQPGRTRAMRQWRMRSKRDIRAGLVQRYVREAVRLAREGKAIRPRARKPEVVMPPELERALSTSRTARAGFEALTPGRQREYAEYIGEAKRADTKARRLARILPLIRAGNGLNDKY